MCDIIYDCGGSSSSTSFQSTYNSLISSTSSFIARNSSSTASSIMGNQATAPVAIGGTAWPPCSITANQTMNLTNSPSGQLTPTQQTQLQNQITQQLQAAAAQKADTSSSTMGGSATTQQNVSINQNIQQVVNQSFENDNYSSVVAQTCGSQSQGAIVIAGDCHVPINLSQTFTATAIATNLLSPMLTTLGGVGSSTTSDIKDDQTNKTITKGPFESLADIFKSYGMIGAAIAAVCLLMCCAGCAFVLFLMMGDKD
jgi:hypothetical protein